MYKIELLCDHKWERSWSFGGEYTLAEAQALITRPGFEQWTFRIVPVRVQYRRHAAASYLELRGAKALLDSVLKYLPRTAVARGGSAPYESYTAAFGIVMQAKLAVTRQLEAL